MAALIVLSQHLEGARFQAFWQAADACKDVVGSVPGYYDAVRSYVLTVITSTCQKASKAMVAESLRLDTPQLEALVRRSRQPSGRHASCGELSAATQRGAVLPGADREPQEEWVVGGPGAGQPRHHHLSQHVRSSLTCLATSGAFFALPQSSSEHGPEEVFCEWRMHSEQSSNKTQGASQGFK